MYQSFYKLTGKPFRLSPDPGFFFPSRGHKRALAYLRYGLKQDEGFVVITGAPGTGKTTLAKILLNEMGDSNVVVAHLTTTQLDSAEMLRMVVASFGLRYESLDKASLLKTLESFLLARARERKRALLVIDEAQNLPASSLEELRMLSNMQAGDKALVQTFLLGQDQFRKVLDHKDMDQLRQRVIANFQLSALAADESQRYIESRLSQVGWSGDPSFAEIVYENIHSYTEGIPRRINMLCDRVLLYACMEERHQITAETLQQVITEIETEKEGAPSSIERLKQTTQASKAAMNKLAQTRKKNKDQLAKSNKGKPKPTVDDAMPTREMEKMDIDDTLIIKGNKANLLGMEDTLSIKGPEADAIRRATIAGNKASKKSGKSGASKVSKKKRAKSATEKPARAAKKDDPNDTAQIIGNTLTKSLPSRAPSRPGASEISERDLFRVIPGGKPVSAPDTGMDRTLQTSAAAAMRPIVPPPSAEDVVLRRILRLVLAFHRSPSRFPGLDNIIQPLPEGITELLELAVSDDQTLTQVSPAAVMGISPVMLRAAVRFFIRRSLFVVDADDHRVLGLQSGAEQSLIEKHYDLLMRLLRQDKQRGSVDTVARIGEAYESLSRIDYAVQSSRLEQQAEKVKLDNFRENKSDTILPKRDTSNDETLLIGKGSDNTNRKVEANGDITFDFTDVQQEPVYDNSGGMLAKIGDTFTFEDHDQDISDKRMRYAGQMAVLGFGALVIILGLYIVQVDPKEDKLADNAAPMTQQPATPKQTNAEEDMVASFAEIDPGTSTQEQSGSDSRNSLSAEQESTQNDIADLLKKMEARRMKVRESRQSDKEDRRRAASSKSRQLAKQESSEASGILDAIRSPRAPAKTSNTVSAKNEVGVKVSERSEPARKVVTIQSRRNPSRSSMIPSPRLTPNPRLTPRTTSTLRASPIVPPLASSQESTTFSQPVVTSIKTKRTVPTGSGISTGDLRKMLSSFSRAYQAGDIGTLTSLFSLNARTNNQTSSVGIRSDYLELFQNTNFRAMSFPSINWENQGPIRARGLGTYEARITPKGSDGAKIYSGKLTMRVEKISNQLKITQFYFTEDGVKNVDNSSQTKTNVRDNVNQAEVDKFISRFVGKYEDGQLNALMSLFSTSARTNDQTTLAGIRKDHKDLFAGTQARQMFLKNMNWRFEGNRAYGSGDFEVLIQPNGSREFVSYAGKITLKMLKENGRIKLTHFLHNTQ